MIRPYDNPQECKLKLQILEELLVDYPV